MGALVGLGIQLLLVDSPNAIMWSWVLVGASFLLGLISIDTAEMLIYERWSARRRRTGDFAIEDFNEMNIDEVHGQLIAGLPVFYLLAPNEMGGRIVFLIAAFVVFRILDTFKPEPIRWVESKSFWLFTSDSPSILLDDTAAGALTALAVSVAIIITKF